ncbi:Ribonuclease D [Moorella thermoacetica]|uniref:DNA polymerase I n=1 Tax=Neomoorella thermoacetica TaxID=1525 RepID=A0AAC9HFG5_NEOTH|nr:DNA polymerase [Moorella thermoacetica]AOQ23007.1 DNA polymerase I, thermostable [Moorella thermoacetica]TYL06559.1 Ribonuclease D [Moorella thermoacetica]
MTILGQFYFTIYTHSLKEIAHRHLEVVLDKEEQASDWSAPELTERQLRYAGMDAAVLLPLREILANLIYKNRLARAAKIEFDCLPAAAEIECAGMPFDSKKAWEMETAVNAAAESARLGLVGLAREAGFRARPKKSGGKYSPDLNPDSAVDVVDCLEILAGREGILVNTEGPGKGFRLPGGEVLPLESRDDTLTRVAAVLPEESELKRFIGLLQEYRGQKKKSDFLKKWIELTHPATGRLHPDLRQLNPQGVGRFSASNPNVQQAGRDKEIRALFRVIEGRKLVLADYSAIEMRVACEVSRDENLLKAFTEGIDVHKFTAASVSGKPVGEVTKSERQFAKSLNFGLIFGMSGKTLQEYAELGYGVKMTLEEAEEAREKFFQLYYGIAGWHERQRHSIYKDRFGIVFRHDGVRGYYVEKRPFVRMPGGHMRVWPVVEEKKKNGGGTYLRKAGPLTEIYNSPVQGGAAELLKVAMGNLYRELLARKWDDVFIVLTLHDELHLEAPEDNAEEALEVLQAAMVGAGEDMAFTVPVEAEGVIGDSWADKA